MSARRGGPSESAPRRPQRVKRSTPVPTSRADPLVPKLCARFEPQLLDDASNRLGRKQPTGSADRSESGGAVCDKRASVLQRARQYDALNTSPRMQQPPVKPPRTFAHDIYTEMKQRMWPNASRRGTAPSLSADDSRVVVAHDYDEVCVDGMRRSVSDEHIYAEPGASRSCCAKPRELHYMSSPISGVIEDGALSPGTRRGVTSQIRDAIRQSFTLARQQLSQKHKRDAADGDTQQADSSSEVSIKDVQKRLVYVRSIKRAYTYNASCDGDGVEKLFEFALLIGYRCIDPSMSPQPDVLYRFPKETDCPGYDPVVIAHLCMPQEFGSEHAASPERCLFFFTLVRENGEKTFFHCLQTPKGTTRGALMGCPETPVVLCLATRASAPAFYHKLLADLEVPLQRLSEPGWTELLSSLAQQSLPMPGCRLMRFSLGQGDVATARPLDDKFDWARLTPLLATLEPPVLMRIVSSLILERRIILVSEDSRLVRGWLESLECLTYPFRWPHVRVPLVPKSLLALCSSGEPYLLGVHAALAHTALELLSGPVLVVDVDRGALLCEDEDNQDVVPKKLRQSLCTALSLANNMTDPTGRVRDMMITEAFVRLFVELVGHCDLHIILSDDLKESTFQRDAFMRSPSSRGAQMFLQWFVETQAFEQFLRERTQRLRQLAKTPHHHLLPKGLFERRAGEYLLDLEHTSRGLRELGKKVKTIGEKFWNLKAFQRE
ncbi:DENN domain-containing protein 2A-like isoform X1 [Dermacentor silvarum]|uniref:DENN domain-containing protein 2A-like isoform X2 n=1 Tax=Dermacentor silvarum TaxID=543639 RepID=UPI0021013CC8|nr:DENN domain-containing protein 2A-like isoform X2 [Dermacentor silvarum]XP_049522349.1 DENN domain-containing protein 2A-like isoform X1 [Dermacentor silvarum]